MSKIPAGYKQTDVGVIPEDWDVSSVGDEFDVKLGKMLDSEKNIGIPKTYIGNRAVQWGKFDLSDLQSVRLQPSETDRYRIRKGDLLVCEGGEVGRAAIWDDEIAECYYQKALHRLRPTRGYSSYLMASYLRYWTTHNMLSDYVTQTSIAHLPREKLILKALPRPPLPEQKRIAQVLGDVDALIQKLEALIAKKRDIKQAAMQELLTGKRRLPGFIGPWETKNFPEVCWFQEGPGVRTHQFTSSGVKLLNGTNISDGKLVLESTSRFISESEAYGWYAHFLVDSGDILIACSGISIEKFDEKVTEAEDEHLPLCMNTSTMRFKVTSTVLIKQYLKHFLKSDSFKNQISGKATGSAQLNFGPSHVMKVHIVLPSSLEQSAIAQVLSDMDNELAQLETRLGKTRDLKAGLMQQLLTGKIRLMQGAV